MKRLYLQAKPSDLGIDVARLAYPLHQHMTHSCQTRGHDLLPSTVLSYHSSG
jgi:hypothetical protein